MYAATWGPFLRRSALSALSALLALFAAHAACAADVPPVQTLTLGRIGVGDVFAQLNLAAEPVANEGGRRAGIAFGYRFLPPLRSIEAANDGEIDGEVIRIAQVATQYPNLMQVPTPISEVVLSIYAASPTIATRTRAEIRQLRIGVVRGHLQTRLHSQGLATIEANLPSSLFEMLASGRCDVVMIEHYQGAIELRDHPMPGVRRWPYAWARDPMYMMLNRKHEALVPRLDAALQQMAREGLIERAYADGLRANRIEPPPPDQPAAR